MNIYTSGQEVFKIVKGATNLKAFESSFSTWVEKTNFTSTNVLMSYGTEVWRNWVSPKLHFAYIRPIRDLACVLLYLTFLSSPAEAYIAEYRSLIGYVGLMYLVLCSSPFGFPFQWSENGDIRTKYPFLQTLVRFSRFFSVMLTIATLKVKLFQLFVLQVLVVELSIVEWLIESDLNTLSRSDTWNPNKYEDEGTFFPETAVELAKHYTQVVGTFVEHNIWFLCDVLEVVVAGTCWSAFIHAVDLVVNYHADTGTFHRLSTGFFADYVCFLGSLVSIGYLGSKEDLILGMLAASFFFLGEIVICPTVMEVQNLVQSTAFQGQRHVPYRLFGSLSQKFLQHISTLMQFKSTFDSIFVVQFALFVVVPYFHLPWWHVVVGFFLFEQLESLITGWLKGPVKEKQKDE